MGFYSAFKGLILRRSRPQYERSWSHVSLRYILPLCYEEGKEHYGYNSSLFKVTSH